jgi:hypothetical protein
MQDFSRTARLKSTCGGGEREREEASESKNLRIKLNNSFISYLTDFFHKIMQFRKGILHTVLVRKTTYLDYVRGGL